MNSTSLFTGARRQRPEINLSGHTNTNNTQDDIKRARLLREQERKRVTAATVLQSHWRRKSAAASVCAQRGQEFDAVPLNRETLVLATSLLLHSCQSGNLQDAATIARLALWCRIVMTDKLLFEPFSNEAEARRWALMLRALAGNLLAIIAQSPLIPQSPLFVEIVKQLVDPSRYPAEQKAEAQALLFHLILKRNFYQSIRNHIIGIPIAKKASATSLQPVVSLVLLPFKHTSEPIAIKSFVEHILSIELLLYRLPIPALTFLSSNLPSKAILQYFAASPTLALSSHNAQNLLANSMALFEPRLKSLAKIDELAGWFELLNACITRLPSSTLLPIDRKGKGKASMDIDDRSSTDTRTSAQIAKLTSPPHLTQILALSSQFASSPRSRPLLARFLLTLLTALPASSAGSNKRDEILALLVYDRSGGSGLLREIWRGWIRSGELMKAMSGSKGKEGWKEVLRCLSSPSGKMVEEWHLLVLSVMLYSRSLVTLGDDEFFATGSKGRNPLMLEEIASLSGLLRNVAFALYWSEIEGVGVPGVLMGAEELRTLVRGFLVAVHERDCRRSFLPVDHFTMTDEFDVQSFVETAVLEDQRIDEEEEANNIAGAPQAEASEEDSDDDERVNLRHRPKAAPAAMSRRQLAFLSPRLGLLNNIPFVIPFETRVSVFRQLIWNDRQREANLSRTSVRDPFMRQPGQRATIRRGHVADDGFQLLHNLGSHGMKQRLQIQFVDEFGVEEAGIDGGGLFKEFLIELGKEAFDVNRGLWRSNTNQEVYPAPHMYAKEPLSLQWFTFLGQIIGKALYEGILVSVPFAPFFLSKWLGKTSFLDDLQSLDPNLYQGLVYLKNYTGDVADLSLTFAVDEDDLGVSRTVDLIPNGRDIAVTDSNRFRYITLISHYRLNTQLREQCAAFVSGLQDVINPRWLRLFSQTELRVLVGGTERPIDVEDLRVNAVYGGIEESSITVNIFWQVLQDFTPEQRRAFVRFVTSADKAPLLGFKELNPHFAIRDGGPDQTRLPSASTCVNLLKLPRYQDRKVLKDKLLMAINSGAGFDLS